MRTNENNADNAGLSAAIYSSKFILGVQNLGTAFCFGEVLGQIWQLWIMISRKFWPMFVLDSLNTVNIDDTIIFIG